MWLRWPALAGFLGGLLLTILLAGATSAHAGSLEDLPGTWTGKLQTGVMVLELQFNLDYRPDGTIGGTLDSITQKTMGIPVGWVGISDTQVRITVPSIGGTFTGELRGDGGEIVGTWEQSGQSIPLTLTYAGAPTASAQPVGRPQTPTPPFPYTTESVTVTNTVANLTLAGTLTLPRGTGPFPAAILVSGSGAQNRDQELFGHKPFAVLADHLARAGIATLRYDDRGFGESTGNPNGTTADFATDAAAVFSYLRGRIQINTHRVGIIGHSEGALIAAQVAAALPDEVGFIVLLNSSGVPGAELMPVQSKALNLTAGASEITANWGAHLWVKFAELLTAHPTDAEAKEAIAAMVRTEYASADPTIRAEVSDLEGQVQALTGLVGVWFREFLTLDPGAVLRAVRCPVLVVAGGKDRQVPPEANLPAIEAALAAGGNKSVEVAEFPELNHLLQTADSGSPQEYQTIAETMSPAVLAKIAKWIAQAPPAPTT